MLIDPHMHIHTHTLSGSARYNTTNDEVQLEHNTLLRYTTRLRAPKVPLPGLPGNGPVHNIAPLYESVEEGRADDALPYEEPTGTLTINQVQMKVVSQKWIKLLYSGKLG